MIRARELTVDRTSYWTLGASRVRPRRQPVQLLPVYDEYLVAYRDRVAVPHGPSVVRTRAGGYVQFQHALVTGGQVAGTWRAVAQRDRVDVNVAPLRPLTTAETRAVRREVARYERFLGVPVSLSNSKRR